MNKTLYSVEFRKSVVSEILVARAGNPNFNMVAFVRENTQSALSNEFTFGFVPLQNQ